MFELNPNTPSEQITAVVVICDLIAFFVFHQLALMMNRGKSEKTIGPKALGAIAVVVVTIFLYRYSQTHLVDVDKYLALSVREQGEYMGRILRSIFFPPLILLAIVATRAWRDKQERLARARQAQLGK